MVNMLDTFKDDQKIKKNLLNYLDKYDVKIK
jgi:hypothetical protein